MDRLALEIGKTLRQTRRERGLTLRDLADRSAGRFKPSAVAGYERGERKISVERFCELARFYDVSPGRLLAHAVRAAEGIPPDVIDFARIDTLKSGEGELLSEFTRQVVELRGLKGPNAISIRVGDLEVLATISGQAPREFVKRIRPALQLAPEPQTPSSSGEG
jgi:transcriptional regulator with XRE-family HTH domain